MKGPEPKYNEGFILSVSQQNKGLRNYLKSIKDILNDDGFYGINPFTGEQAIDLDRYEKELHKSKSDCTVDIVTAVGKCTLLLVENKTNVRWNNFDETLARKIKDKVKHSRDIVFAWNGFVDIYNRYYTLLRDERFEEHKRRARNLMVSNQYEFLTVGDFYNRLKK